MKAFWKILGLGALAVGLTPYKVEKNEETGERSYQALLWKGTVGPGSENDKKNIDIDLGINLGEGTLTSKLMGGAKKAEESHLFSDELCVEYTGGEDNVTETVEEAAEKVAEEVEAAVEEVAEEVEEAAAVAEEAAEVVEEEVTPETQEAEEPKAE